MNLSVLMKRGFADMQLRGDADEDVPIKDDENENNPAVGPEVGCEADLTNGDTAGLPHDAGQQNQASSVREQEGEGPPSWKRTATEDKMLRAKTLVLGEDMAEDSPIYGFESGSDTEVDLSMEVEPAAADALAASPDSGSTANASQGSQGDADSAAGPPSSEAGDAATHGPTEGGDAAAGASGAAVATANPMGSVDSGDINSESESSNADTDSDPEPPEACPCCTSIGRCGWCRRDIRILTSNLQ